MPFEYQFEEVYRPAEDTYLLLRAALQEARVQDTVIEVGCGSALISRELSANVKSLLATDISPHAVRAAKEAGVDVVRADLLCGIKGRFDLILFNPPYLPTQEDERTGGWINYALDGGPSGSNTINRFLEQLRHHLTAGGRALLLISSLTGIEEVKEKASKERLEAREVASEGCFFERLHVLRIEAAKKK
jgi:release factor glutamine methyltransferase